MLFHHTLISSIALWLFSSFSLGAEANLPLDKIKMPKGFKIAIYARVPGARSMTVGRNGTLFVGTRDTKVFAVQDKNGDHVGETVVEIAKDLNEPNGVAIKDGALYIAEISRVSKITDIENRMGQSLTLETVSDAFPKDKHHGWKFIAFGPDGKLYVPVGAPCNICEPKKEYANISRMNADGSQLEVFASGIRNTVGFAWHPVTKELWFTDNGRDMLGDDVPPDELNRAAKAGLDFGYPRCHGKDIVDPEFGKPDSCKGIVVPEATFPAHVAALGMRFYTGKQFPKEYRNAIFTALHGSWNRSKPVGYEVRLVKLDKNGKANEPEVFASGWLQDGKAWGRPVDVQPLKDGSMLVSDDQAGIIYRIAYHK